jgi:acid stress-induced BolA-like protein IbaG/YrbA
MGGENQFSVTAGGANGRGGETSFTALASGKNKFVFANAQAVELARIIERQKAAFQSTAVSELFHHRSDVAAGALHAACGIEFGKEADEHALSLPSTTPERKKKQRTISPHAAKRGRNRI